ncbi:MAG: PKD domain-containing protein [Saprospiraceae bacterium]
MRIVFLKALFFIGFLVLSNSNVQASHIVGGEMTYRCLGGNNYEIRLTLRRDCFNGSPEAEFDDPAHIGIFDSEGNILRELGKFGVIQMPFRNDDTLNEILKTECEVIGGDVCVHTTTYIGKVTLPMKKGGYLLVYQRCCRNKTISNIVDPDLAGATYTVVISEEGLRTCNSSPTFGDWPPVYICGDRPITFIHSVFDLEGDSVTYSLCAPYVGADTANSKPSTPKKPPYIPVVYKSPFSLFNLLNGNPALSIDRKTGLITGQPEPNTVGQYLVGVCVNEYRNGKLLSQVRRDFEYNVRICTTNPVSNFEPDKDVLCTEDRLVNFTNKSYNAKDFTWFFDYPRNTFTSKDTNPSFTFPSSGSYRVALIARRAKDCIDTTFQNIYVYDSTLLGADFDFSIGSCKDSILVNFSDKSFDSLLQVKNWNWDIRINGNRYASTKRNPTFLIPDTGMAKIQLIIFSSGGCFDSIQKDIFLNRLQPEFPVSGIPICLGDSTFILGNPNGKFTYTWSPGTTLSCSNCPNPVAFPSVDTWYKVLISDGQCSVEDSVLVKVSNLLDIDVIGDKIVCSDSVFLRASGGVENTIEWSDRRDFSNILTNGNFDFNTLISKKSTFYVRGKSNANCPGLDSITIENEKVKIDFTGNNYRFCEGDSFLISINNLDTTHQLQYNWTPANKVITGQGSKEIKATTAECSNLQFVVSATNQFQCSASDTVNVNIVCKPQINFEVNKNCDNTLVSFINSSANGNYTWDFGDSETSTEKSPIHNYKKTGRYIVKLIVNAECNNELIRTIDVGFIPVQLNDTTLSCNGESVFLNPDPDLKYNYIWSPADKVSDPNSPNPLSKSDTTITYKVRVLDPSIADCFIERLVTVFVPPKLNLSINNDTILCSLDTITLQAYTNQQAKIEWLNGVGLFLGDGYQLRRVFRDSQYIHGYATDIYGCTTQDSFLIIPIKSNVKIIGDSAICPSETGFVEFIQSDKYKYSFSWSPTNTIVSGKNSNRIIVKPMDTTTYYLEYINEYGCRYNDSFKVNISQFTPPLTAYADEDTIYFGKSTTLHVTKGFRPYKWVNPNKLSCDDCEDPIASPEVSTLYKVIATDESGCIGEATVKLIVIRPSCNETDVFLPNIFSPNSDSNNDELTINSNFIEKLELYIYDRWGEKVYETNDINFKWDGTYKGAELKPDVYGYYFKVLCVDGKTYSDKGNLTIIR